MDKVLFIAFIFTKKRIRINKSVNLGCNIIIEENHHIQMIILYITIIYFLILFLIASNISFSE